MKHPSSRPRPASPAPLRSIRFGFNPNSSSLGADVTGLLLGGAFAALLSIAIAVWIRLSARLGGATPHGAASAGGPPPAPPSPEEAP